MNRRRIVDVFLPPVDTENTGDIIGNGRLGIPVRVVEKGCVNCVNGTVPTGVIATDMMPISLCPWLCLTFLKDF